MNAVRVIQPGMMTTVQDLGRPGQSRLGVARGGAADALSLRLGNRLVGNADGAAGLEMTVLGGEFEFERAAVVAVTGGVAEVEVTRSDGSGGGERRAPWAGAFAVRSGDRVRVGPVRRGVRAYVCVAGGLEAAVCMGSRSTSIAGGFGGLQGRSLRVGDVLAIGDDVGVARAEGELAAAILERALFGNVLRACAVEASGVDPKVILWVWSTTFLVESNSDRMGVRLRGAGVESGASLEASGRMISEGMMHGAVQMPQSGMPIVLGVEHPTTGGYPVVACVATVDLPALGQCGPGRAIRFAKVDHATARGELAEFEARLNAEVPGR